MQIDLPIDEIVSKAVKEALAQIADNADLLPPDRLSFTEKEAAEKLGIQQHVLRDCRLRGEITASKIGAKNCYTRRELLDFLERQRQGGSDGA